MIERTKFDPERIIQNRFSEISKEDIEKAAKEIFVRKNLTLSLKGKPKRIDTDGIARILSSLDPDRPADR